MNHLDVITKMKELASLITDKEVSNFWSNEIHQSSEPEKVIERLRKALSDLNHFTKWCEEFHDTTHLALGFERKCIVKEVILGELSLVDAKDKYLSLTDEETKRVNAVFDS